MNVPEGSCAPSVLFKGGPPGIPGSPRPTEPNDFPRLELGIEPMPCVGVTAAPEDSEPLTPNESDATGCDAGLG